MTSRVRRLHRRIVRMIEGSVARAPVSGDDRARLLQYTVLLLLGGPVMVAYAVANLAGGHLLTSAMILVVAGALVLGWIRLRRLEDGRPVYRLNGVLFAGLILYLLAVGGEGGSKILWMYTFPPIAFFMLGCGEGLFWSAAVLVAAAILLLVPLDGIGVHAYPHAFETRFLTAYLMMSAVTFWFEHFRQSHRAELEETNQHLEEGHLRLARDNEERRRAELEKEVLIARLQAALKDVRTLRGLIPICAQCHKIRDDEGFWNQLESYLRKHSDAEFSHGICPECMQRLYPELQDGLQEDLPRKRGQGES